MAVMRVRVVCPFPSAGRMPVQAHSQAQHERHDLLIHLRPFGETNVWLVEMKRAVFLGDLHRCMSIGAGGSCWFG